MKVIIQLMRNKMIKVYTEVLRHKADPSQPALLRGALPARGIPLSCGVNMSLPQHLHLAAGTQPTALWGKESVERR